MKSGTIFLVLALIISTTSYCIALLVSREAPIPYLAIGGFGALALVVLSMWGLWFLTDYEKSDEPELPYQESNNNQ